MSKVKEFFEGLWANPVVKNACLTAIIVAGSIVVESAKTSIGGKVTISVQSDQK